MVEVRPIDAPRRLGLLDASRLAAALGVVAFHWTGRSNPAWGQPVETVFPFLTGITKYGALGVYVFFMISGFVVLMSAWGRTPGHFVASRVGRLYPAYWFAVLATGALLFFQRHHEIGRPWPDIGFTGVVANLTMMQSALGVPHVDGVYWTLWVELKFYVLIGLLVLVGLTERRALAFVIFWPLVGAIARMTGTWFLNELLFPDLAPYFALGMVLYLVYRRGWTPLLGVAFALNLVLAVSLSSTAVRPFYAAIASIQLSPTVTSAVVVAFAGFLILVTQTRLAQVHGRFLLLAGSLTYPLYLVHEMWGWVVIQQLYPALPKYLVMAIALPIVLLFAWLIHRFVEKPLGPRLRAFVMKGFETLRRDDDRSRAATPSRVGASGDPAAS